MIMLEERLFFPLLKRREQYSVKRDGKYYADYSRYKEEIRVDCLGRCVYCDTHENELNGPSSMALDHFRPKDHEQFTDLISDPHNLVWACSACNRAKWNYWPALGTDEAMVNGEGFIDPFIEDRTTYFDVADDGEIVAVKPPAKYIIELLNLNRPTPVQRRKARLVASQLLPLLTQDIARLEMMNKLSDKEQEELRLKKLSLELTSIKLDFILK